MPKFPPTFRANTEVWPGCWRGEIAVVDDSQERARYRVRVFHMHDEAIKAEELPYAELGGSYAFKGGGDIPVYERGDLVWVMFEGASREYPVILGGWISEKGGIPDLPLDQQQDYATNRRRWLRRDRAGNVLELSSVPGRERVLVKSGRAEISLTKLNNGIAIKALDGPVTLDASRCTVKAGEVQLEGGNTTLLANGQTPPVDPTAAFPTPGVASGTCDVFSNSELRLYAGNVPGTDPFGIIKIGQYVDAALVARQTGIVRLQPQLLELGVAITTDGTAPTLFVDAACSSRMRLLAPLVILGKEGFEDFLVKYTQLKLEFDAHVHGETGGTTLPPSVPLSALASTLNTKAS